MDIRLDLPWPPSVNHYKKVGKIVRTKNGKYYQMRFPSCQTRCFYQDVCWTVQEARLKGVKFVDSTTIALGVTVHLHPPSNRPYDIDNRLKVLFDALTEAEAWPDDRQVVSLYVRKMDKIKLGKVLVTIQDSAQTL